MSRSTHPAHRSTVAVLLAAACVLGVTSCGDDDAPDPEFGAATSTTAATTTTTADPGTGAARGGRASITGTFGDDEVRLDMAQDTSCEIEDAGDGATASVTGGTEDGNRFTLVWDEARPRSAVVTLVVGGTTWSAGPAEATVAAPDVRVAGVGAVSLHATFSTIDGAAREAQLLLRCLAA